MQLGSRKCSISYNFTHYTYANIPQRGQYGQLWQSSIVELENQKDREEIIAMTTRLSLLTNEVVLSENDF